MVFCNIMEGIIKEVDKNFYMVFCEIRNILTCIQKNGVADMENYLNFFLLLEEHSNILHLRKVCNDD